MGRPVLAGPGNLALVGDVDPGRLEDAANLGREDGRIQEDFAMDRVVTDQLDRLGCHAPPSLGPGPRPTVPIGI